MHQPGEDVDSGGGCARVGAEGQFHVVFHLHTCRVGCRKLFMCGDSSLSKTAQRFGTSIHEL